MKVLIVGSGAREHALAWKISQSPLLTKLYAAPGNAGINEIAEAVSVAAHDIDGLLAFAKTQAIDLTVVGPEVPLVAGIQNRFEEAGLKVFGPSREAAQLEGSKAFAKDRMLKYGIPTADYEVFGNINEAKHYAVEAEMPVVVKADGLAAGKGVMICQSSQEAVEAITQMMGQGIFGDAGKKIVVEELIEGEELSVLVLTDGERIIPLASSQDHKRAYDNDRGPNTGGMGAYSPCPQLSPEKFSEIIDLTVRPMIQGMAKDGILYRGVLYAGLMLTDKGPYVLEYNCRFGDPETQVVLPRMKSDLLPVMMEIAEGRLKTEFLDWHSKACLSIVIASGGYPGHYDKGVPIQGLETLKSVPDLFVFHAGTVKRDSETVTDGGRVLAVTALGETMREAHDRAYQNVGKIQCSHSFYRRDIGRRAAEVLQ